MSDDSAMAAVADRWESLGFDAFLQELEKNAQGIEQRRQQGEESRRSLVDTTHEFREVRKTQVLEERLKKSLATVIKAYQQEIDSVTRRARAAEQAVLSVYKQFHDIPDPVPALRRAVVNAKSAAAAATAAAAAANTTTTTSTLAAARGSAGLGAAFTGDLETTVGGGADEKHTVAALRTENARLRDTLDDYHRDLAEVKNQEVTIKRLRERVRASETEVATRVAASVQEERQRMQREHDEMQSRVRERENQVQKLTGTMEASERRLLLQVEDAQTRLMEVRAQMEEQQSAHTAEIDMLMTDLERANGSLSSAEKDLELLRARLHENSISLVDGGNGAGGTSGGAGGTVGGFAAELAAKDREVSELVSEVQQLQQQRRADADRWAQETTRNEEQVRVLTSRVAQLEGRLEAMRDYDDVCAENRVLKHVEFGDAATTVAATAGGGDAGGTRPLEALLLDKSRALQTELVRLRAEVEEERQSATELRDANSELQQTVRKQTALVGRLESDLLNMQPGSPMYVGSPAPRRRPSDVLSSQAVVASSSAAPILLEVLTASGGDGGTMERVATTRGEGTDGSESALPTTVGPESTTGTREALVGAESTSVATESSILSIVAGQRDRLRQRITDLEAESTHLQQKMLRVEQECQSVRTDNVQLYEKIKFLQSYTIGDRQAASAAAASASVPMGDTAAIAASSSSSSGPVERYSAAYEDRLNPFREFSNRERQRRIQSLGPIDRCTLNTGRFILGSGQSRRVFFFYTVALHLLVFMVVFKLSSMSEQMGDHDRECTEAYATHMIQFHNHH